LFAASTFPTASHPPGSINVYGPQAASRKLPTHSRPYVGATHPYIILSIPTPCPGFHCGQLTVASNGMKPQSETTPSNMQNPLVPARAPFGASPKSQE